MVRKEEEEPHDKAVVDIARESFHSQIRITRIGRLLSTQMDSRI
ncbi:MAG: hypothetical protein ACUVWK_01945 [Nitrososphaerales archaeon]